MSSVIFVKARPNSKFNQIRVLDLDTTANLFNFCKNLPAICLEVNIKAQNQDNQANVKLIEILSDFFKVSKKDIEIISGNTGKLKQIQINCDQSFLLFKLNK